MAVNVAHELQPFSEAFRESLLAKRRHTALGVNEARTFAGWRL
jgi:hypothetical protein